MKLAKVILFASSLFYAASMIGQNERDSISYIPPDRSYFSEFGQARNFVGGVPRKPRMYRVSKYITWEAGYFCKGVIASGQGIRLGKSPFMLNSVVGINVFKDRFQRSKFLLANQGFGEGRPDDYSVDDLMKYGYISDVGIFLQGSFSFDFKYSDIALELGCRFVKSKMSVEGQTINGGFSIFAWERTLYGIEDVPIMVFTPYIGLLQVQPKRTENDIFNFRMSLGLDFYQFQRYKSRYTASTYEPPNYSYDKAGSYRQKPFVCIMFSLGLGKGSRAE